MRLLMIVVCLLSIGCAAPVVSPTAIAVRPTMTVVRQASLLDRELAISIVQRANSGDGPVAETLERNARATLGHTPDIFWTAERVGQRWKVQAELEMKREWTTTDDGRVVFTWWVSDQDGGVVADDQVDTGWIFFLKTSSLTPRLKP